jgi:hypothetical protein
MTVAASRLVQRNRRIHTLKQVPERNSHGMVIATDTMDAGSDLRYIVTTTGLLLLKQEGRRVWRLCDATEVKGWKHLHDDYEQ